MATFQYKGIELHYEDLGAGKPLVLLHGFTGSSKNWRPLAERLAQDYRVILPDIIGHGRSSSPQDAKRYAIERAAEDIAALVNEPFYLVGYSMGARLALTIAVHYPEHVRKLVLESGTAGLKTEEEQIARLKSDETLATSVDRRGMVWFVNYWESLPLWQSQQRLSPQTRQWLNDLRLDNDPVGLANSLRGMGTGMMPPLWENLPFITQPTLLIVGDEDQKYVNIAKEMVSAIPNATLEIVEEAGHAVHLEQPKMYEHLIREFLRDDPPVSD